MFAVAKGEGARGRVQGVAPIGRAAGEQVRHALPGNPCLIRSFGMLILFPYFDPDVGQDGRPRQEADLVLFAVAGAEDLVCKRLAVVGRHDVQTDRDYPGHRRDARPRGGRVRPVRSASTATVLRDEVRAVNAQPVSVAAEFGAVLVIRRSKEADDA